eukprot:m.26370 g.26370  ORF g.26370 m.26370 type:complete len:93 (+) comp9269_c0_seq1:169-447(+)
MSEQDVKPKVEDEYLNLKVVGQNGNSVHFKIKKKTQLKKLMDTYCQRQGLNKGSVRFMFDGEQIKDTDTPALLEMEDSDSIDVFQQQTGGCC